MRKMLAAVVSISTLVPAVWAGDDKQSKPDASGQAQTIRGVVASVTAEGEAVLDTRTNTAMTVEGAYLTVVGFPTDMKKEAGTSGNQSETSTRDPNNPARSSKNRDNVYMVWLSPKTKVCEKSSEAGKAEAGKSATKDVTIDQLELGDRVEIQFSRSQDSQTNASNPRQQQMRRKHGRDRTFVVFADSITILPAKDREGHFNSESKDSATGTSANNK